MPASSRDHVPLFTILIDGQELDPVEARLRPRDQDHRLAAPARRLHAQVGYPARPRATRSRRSTTPSSRSASRSRSSSAPIERADDPAAVQGRDRHASSPTSRPAACAMVVRAYDRSHRMMRSRKQRTFLNQTTSRTSSGRSCGEHGHQHRASTASGAPHDFVLQHNETDWDFVLAAGEAHRLRVHRRRHGRRSSQAARRQRREGRAQLPRRPAHVPPAHHRGPAGREGQRARLRLQGQAAVERTATSPQQVTEPGSRASMRGERSRGALARDRRPVVRAPGRGRRRWPRRCSTSSPTPTSPRRARARRPAASRPAPCSRSRASAASSAGTYRVAKAVHAITGGGGYTTSFSNSVGEHTILGAGRRRSAGADSVDSIVIGIVTNNSDPEKLGRVRSSSRPDRAGELLGPGHLPSAGKERGL